MAVITLIIAILGFILSLAQWIYTFYSKRTHFSMSIEKFQWHHHSSYDRAIITFMIWNMSDSPLIITKMSINDVNCLISHQWIGDRYYPNPPENDIPKTERNLSPDFPITLTSKSGGLYSIIFDFEKDTITWDRFISVKVQTAHKVKNFTLYHPNYNPEQLYF